MFGIAKLVGFAGVAIEEIVTPKSTHGAIARVKLVVEGHLFKK